MSRIPKMIVKIIVFGCIICTISAQNENSPRGAVGEDSPSFKKCLTGYMTDIQSWVSANGSLTRFVARQNAVDLSYTSDALPMLLHHLTVVRKKSHLVKILSMASCGLQEIPQIFSWSVSKNKLLSETIEYVSFYGNHFDVLMSTGQKYDVVMNASRSMELVANSVIQRITKSWSSGFVGIKFPKLKELDLRACSIATLEDRVFEQMPHLENLYLGENAITHLEANAFAGLKDLIHLDLSRNFAYDENNTQKALSLESMNIFSNLKNLQSLDFSFTTLTPRNSAVLANLTPKMQRLSLCHCNLGRLQDAIFSKTSIKYLDLSGNAEVLIGPKALDGLQETLKILYAENCDLKTMEPFRNFPKLEILKLVNNDINLIPKHVVETLNNLQVLDLDKNRIVTWFNRNVHLMPKLKFFSVRHNNINMITDEMATDLANISYVGVADNFIICNCNARDLYELGWRNELRVKNQVITEIGAHDPDKRLSFHTGFEDYNEMIKQRNPLSRTCDHRRKCDMDLELKFDGDLLFFDYNPKEYECLLVTERKSTGFQNFPTCTQEFEASPTDMVEKTWNRLFLFLIPLILLPALAFLFIFRRNLKYFIITLRNSATLSLISKNDSQDDSTIFNYDVFVSYCNEDRAWVLDQLLPHVERDCNISVCLHERDFQVGLSILENIVSCMDRSRSIMLILSKRFLLSQWCQFEMHLAQHRLLETRREDLILVLLEEIPRRLRPNTLHYLMLTKTYIVWPTTQGEESQFWRRLKKSLVTHKLKHTENVSLA